MKERIGFMGLEIMGQTMAAKIAKGGEGRFRVRRYSFSLN